MAPDILLIFRIGKDSRVDFTAVDSFTYGVVPLFGLYQGEVCLIQLYPAYHKGRRVERARLYRMEAGGLAAVPAGDGSRAEIVYTNSSVGKVNPDTGMTTILEIHSPADPPGRDAQGAPVSSRA